MYKNYKNRAWRVLKSETLVAGVIDPDETPLEAAKRELIGSLRSVKCHHSESIFCIN